MSQMGNWMTQEIGNGICSLSPLGHYHESIPGNKWKSLPHNDWLVLIYTWHELVVC